VDAADYCTHRAGTSESGTNSSGRCQSLAAALGMAPHGKRPLQSEWCDVRPHQRADTRSYRRQRRKCRRLDSSVLWVGLTQMKKRRLPLHPLLGIGEYLPGRDGALCRPFIAARPPLSELLLAFGLASVKYTGRCRLCHTTPLSSAARLSFSQIQTRCSRSWGLQSRISFSSGGPLVQNGLNAFVISESITQPVGSHSRTPQFQPGKLWPCKRRHL